MNTFATSRAPRGLLLALTVAALLAIGALAGYFYAGRGSHDAHGHATALHAHGAAPGDQTTPAASTAPDHIRLDEAQIRTAGITLADAAPARVGTTLQLPGEIRLNADRTAHVVPRLAGVVEQVSADLGQQVKKGQVLAQIASAALAEQRSEWFAAQKRQALAKTTFEREKTLWEDRISAEQDYLQAEQALQESDIALANAKQKLIALGTGPGSPATLNRYELRAPFDSLIVEKHLTLGEAIREDTQVFTLSDLSTVWAEISVPARDLAHVRVGSTVTLRAGAFDASARGTVTYVGALLGEQTRSALARVVLQNPDAAWRPGLFVTVELAVDETDAAVTVEADAIQTVDGKPSVFVRTADGFAVRAVRTGRSDGRRTEITGGLRAGERYAAANGFILKSELGKDAAGHDH